VTSAPNAEGAGEGTEAVGAGLAGGATDPSGVRSGEGPLAVGEEGASAALGPVLQATENANKAKNARGGSVDVRAMEVRGCKPSAIYATRGSAADPLTSGAGKTRRVGLGPQ